MDKKNKRAVIVGIFVFLALVIFVLGVMTLGGQQSVLNKGATIHAVFDDVAGLQPGNNVRYAGVKVGTVRKLSFTNDGRIDVAMNIERESLDVIRNGVRAKVGSEGFIGNKTVVLTGGSRTAPVVQDGALVPTETTVSTEEMMATLQENNRNILAITNNFKAISEQIAGGEGTVGKLLRNEDVYRDLQASMNSLRVAANNAQAAAQGAQYMVSNLRDYTNKLTAKGSLANDLVTDTVIFSRLRSTTRQIDQLSEQASLVMNDLQTASRSLNQSMTDTSTTVGLLLNNRATAADVQATIQNLRAGTKKLDENMEALQSNFLFRGFFRRRAQSQ
jgi:phospholipid/cholesterol/gamma-HCH transport system substrate-binding protein